MQLTYFLQCTLNSSDAGENVSFISAPAPAFVELNGNCKTSFNCIGTNSSNGVITGANDSLLNNFTPTSPVQGIIGPSGGLGLSRER